MPRPLRRPQRKPLRPRTSHQPILPNLHDALKGARRIALVGVGSELRGDDAVGVLVARSMATWCARTRSRRLVAFDTGTAPENFSGEIIRSKPDCVIFLDAAHLPGREPGSVEIIPPEEIEGLSFSTHMLPAPIFLDYLEKATGCRSLVMGIQIEQKDVLAELSPSVKSAAHRLAAAFRRALVPRARPAKSKAKPRPSRQSTKAKRVSRRPKSK